MVVSRVWGEGLVTEMKCRDVQQAFATLQLRANLHLLSVEEELRALGKNKVEQLEVKLVEPLARSGVLKSGDYDSLLTERKTVRYLVAAAWISVFLLACDGRDPVVGEDNNGDQRTEEGDQRTEDGDQRTEEGDRAQLMEMRGEIVALIGEAAGTSIADCRYAGLGAKPCGGPWEYIVYSVSSTDSTALADHLAAYDAFEAEMNERYGYVSDCSVPNIPVLAFKDGRCIAE